MDNDDSNLTVSGTADLYKHDTLQYVEASSNPICVEWAISADKSLCRPTDRRRVHTSSDIDYTFETGCWGRYREWRFAE